MGVKVDEGEGGLDGRDGERGWMGGGRVREGGMVREDGWQGG